MGMFLSRLTPWRNVCSVFSTLWELLREGLQFLRTISQSRAALAAEILFLRKQLAYYQDHRIRPRRLRDASRLSLWFWSHLSIGRGRSWSSRRVLSCVGIAKASSSTGVGSCQVAARRSRNRFASSSLVWSEKT